MKPPAPLLVDVMALNQWLLTQLAPRSHPLAQRICQVALDLLEAVSLALHGRDRERQVDTADERLIVLRTLLRLAEDTAVLTESQFLHLLPRMEAIGRQVGGWRRSLGPV